MRIRKYIFLGLLFLLSGCTSTKFVESSFSDKIVIDGNHAEWGTNLKPVDGKNIAFGFVNDKENLFISVITSDKNDIRKIIMNGMTIWLESTEGELGIKYPIRLDPSEIRLMRMEQFPEQKNEVALMMNILKARNELQVINREDLPLYTYRAEAGEKYKAKINIDGDKLVYEMQIPLRDDITKRVFAKDVNEVYVRFQTGEMERDEKRGGNNQGMHNSGGRGGRGGGGMKNPGGMRQPGEKIDFNPMDYSFKVKLN